GVELVGKLKGWAQAKDVILELLSRLSVKGGVGSVIEYYGDGVKTLSVPERATITNMGAELGATSSIFPSDERTREFLRQNSREEDFTPLSADENIYDDYIKIDLSEIKPLIACPHSPDNVKKASEIEGLKVDQVCIGSCTNSSLYDMLLVAKILKGKTISPDVSLSISPGSRQVLTQLSQMGALADMIAAGARILECACGPCIGMGNSPKYGGVSVRTFNRNFEGRSGTANGQVYLASPAVAAVAAIYGKIVDPEKLGVLPEIVLPEKFAVNDSMTIIPDFKGEVEKGPNIKSVPIGVPVGENLTKKVVLKVGDNITTDHIMPAGSKILPYRSNIPYLSQFCFKVCDEKFSERAKEEGGGIIVGGENYGQGSSREHAALVPLYLGIRAVVVKSFARIHVANLINAGIIPLTFDDPSDYDFISEGNEIGIEGLKKSIESDNFVTATCGNKKIKLKIDLSKRQRDIILKGGLLNYTKENK
ncbi:MAG: aconitate hydratase, partial [Clostridia bacterium]|nr:aconitate hydratase [Clostridia bacterium]